jgi:hypothetical protein
VVVAADLRDNPVQTVRLSPTDGACGYLVDFAGEIEVGGLPDIRVGFSGLVGRGFCSFALPPQAMRVEQATLELYQTLVLETPYPDGPVLVDHLDFGTSLGADDWDRPSFLSPFGTISSDATLGIKTLDVTSAVRSDVGRARAATQFRFRFANDYAPGMVVFSNAGQTGEPTLVLSYRKP